MQIADLIGMGVKTVHKHYFCVIKVITYGPYARDIRGVGSAVFAAYATFQAKRTIEFSVRQSENSRILDEIFKLAERCNSCVGEDSFVIEKKKNWLNSQLLAIMQNLPLLQQKLQRMKRNY